MDILDILKKYDLELSEENKADFEKDFRKAFKSAAELQKVKTELSTVQADLEKANEVIEQSKSKSVDVAEIESKYQAEIEKYKGQIADIEFSNLLSSELKGIEFSSDRVKSSIVEEIKSKGFKVEDGKLTGLSAYLQELYKNEPQAFKTVDEKIHTWGVSSSNNSETKDEKGTYDSYFGTIL